MTRKLSRRQAVVSTVGLGVGATTVAAVASDDARAQGVTVDEFAVQDTEHTSPDGMVSEVRAVVDAAYAYKTSTEPADLRLELHAGRDHDTATEIAAKTIDVSGTTAEGSVELAGPLSWAGDYEIADFRPAESGDHIRQDVALSLRVALRDGDGGSMDTARAETTARVTVHNEADVLRLEVGGSGTLEVEE